MSTSTSTRSLDIIGERRCAVATELLANVDCNAIDRGIEHAMPIVQSTSRRASCFTCSSAGDKVSGA